jgi:hypothetical protein
MAGSPANRPFTSAGPCEQTLDSLWIMNFLVDNTTGAAARPPITDTKETDGAAEKGQFLPRAPYRTH